MDSIVILSLLTVFLLVLMTAFFVGAEFSLINLKTARIDQLILEGNKKAKLTKKIIDHLDYYLSACQLGITLTAIGLGWLGQPAVEQILNLLLQDFGIGTLSLSIISFTIAFAFIAFIRIVFGELTPKNLAVHFAERMALAFSGPLFIFGFLMAPFIKLMKGTAILFLRIFGIEMSDHPQGHSEEELKIIMTQSYHSGEINQTELSYMRNIFSFDERQAKDIMLPR
ncbi:MAG TPA: CNNM domain-containing protein, partial [Planococcus sp. (in: firmicutes)]|nr:CNNM domain-containing protein [Planococcus sp. (in: firmicutes)]